MRLLIDTQIFIWVVLDSDKLDAKARQSPDAKPMADGQSEADGSVPKK